MAKQESEFVAVACLVRPPREGKEEPRVYFDSGEVLDRSEFDPKRFDKLVASGSILKRGAGDQLPGASSTATSGAPREGIVDRTGESSDRRVQKR